MTYVPIPGYEDYYAITNDGRVMRTKSVTFAKAGSILKPRLDKGGYEWVVLSKGGKRKDVCIHRLVIEIFGSPQPSNDHEVNHKNGNKTDNRIENLEWLTKGENVRHAIDIGLWDKRSYRKRCHNDVRD